MSVCVSSALSIATSLAAVAGIPGETDLTGGSMSLSHMSVSQSLMQPLSHALASSMLNMPGIDHQSQNTAAMSQQHPPQLHNPHLHSSPLTNGSAGSDITDHPNPDMLLALIARNKTLEGKCDLWWLPNLSTNNGQ